LRDLRREDFFGLEAAFAFDAFRRRRPPSNAAAAPPDWRRDLRRRAGFDAFDDFFDAARDFLRLPPFDALRPFLPPSNTSFSFNSLSRIVSFIYILFIDNNLTRFVIIIFDFIKLNCLFLCTFIYQTHKKRGK
jgi:hypothetical protein